MYILYIADCATASGVHGGGSVDVKSAYLRIPVVAKDRAWLGWELAIPILNAKPGEPQFTAPPALLRLVVSNLSE